MTFRLVRVKSLFKPELILNHKIMHWSYVFLALTHWHVVDPSSIGWLLQVLALHGMLTRPWWRHQMETFSALLAICAGNSPVPVNSSHKGQWRGALVFSLICVWINGWVNNREAGDLRRYRAQYDVIVMQWVRLLVCSGAAYDKNFVETKPFPFQCKPELVHMLRCPRHGVARPKSK